MRALYFMRTSALVGSQAFPRAPPPCLCLRGALTVASAPVPNFPCASSSSEGGALWPTCPRSHIPLHLYLEYS